VSDPITAAQFLLLKQENATQGEGLVAKKGLPTGLGTLRLPELLAPGPDQGRPLP
jgi:hypothetical protein